MLSPLVSRKLARGVGERRDVGEERPHLVVAVLEGAGRRDRVAQDLGDLGHHVGVGVGHLRGEPQVVDDLRDLGVEPLEVGVERLEVLAEPLAAALERGGDRVEGHVELGRLHGAQQRVEVGEHLLDLDRDLGTVDGLPDLERLAATPRALGDLQRDVLLAEQRLRHDRAGDVGRGSALDLARVEAQGELGPLGGGLEVEHLADDDAAHLDVGALAAAAGRSCWSGGSPRRSRRTSW